MDEKIQFLAFDRTAPSRPMLSGVPRHQDHRCVRHGGTNIYAAPDIAAGHAIADLSAGHHAREFRRILDLIDRSVPDELAVHVVLYNVATHRTAANQRWLQRHPCFTIHFIPTDRYLVENRFAELTSMRLWYGAHHSVADVTSAVGCWGADWDEGPRSFVRHKTAY